MSLRDDLAAMERYQRAGRLRDYFTGDGPCLPPEPMPLDDTREQGLGQYERMSRRGE